MPLKTDMQEPKPTGSKNKPKSDSDDNAQSAWKVVNGRRVRQGRKLPYESQIHQLFIEVSGLVALADTFSAKAIELKSEELAYGYARLAKDDPRVRAFFEKLMMGSSWSAALLPTVTLIIAIGWHHGFIPSRVGVPMAFAGFGGELPIITREEELQARVDAQRQQEAAAQAAAAANGGNNGDGDES